MKKYETKQRRMLLEFFKSNVHTAFSARQLGEIFAQEGISQSAIYRNLSQMEQENLLCRSTHAGEKEALYRYIDPVACRGHLHLVCTECGETSHVSRKVSDELSHAAKESHGFSVSFQGATLYGTCEECAPWDECP